MDNNLLNTIVKAIQNHKTVSIDEHSITIGNQVYGITEEEREDIVEILQQLNKD